MLYDPQNFLHSMCRFAAARAATVLSPSLTVNYAIADGAAPWNLFLNEADEDCAAEPHAVLINYPGSHERTNPKPTLRVQLAAYGKSNKATHYLANCLYRALCLDNQEQELRTVAIPGFKLSDNSSDGTWVLVNAVTINTPGQIGRDDRGRVKVVSNFEYGFYKKT